MPGLKQAGLIANKLDSKVVEDKGECDGMSCVLPKRRDERYGSVSILCKVVDEAVIGDAAGLFQTRHPFPDLHVHPTTLVDFRKGVLAYDLVRDLGEAKAYVFVTLERRVVVEIFNVRGSKPGPSGGDGAI